MVLSEELAGENTYPLLDFNDDGISDWFVEAYCEPPEPAEGNDAEPAAEAAQGQVPQLAAALYLSRKQEFVEAVTTSGGYAVFLSTGRPVFVVGAEQSDCAAEMAGDCPRGPIYGMLLPARCAGSRSRRYPVRSNGPWKRSKPRFWPIGGRWTRPRQSWIRPAVWKPAWRKPARPTISISPVRGSRWVRCCSFKRQARRRGHVAPCRRRSAQPRDRAERSACASEDAAGKSHRCARTGRGAQRHGARGFLRT